MDQNSELKEDVDVIEMCNAWTGGFLESTIHVLAFASLEHNNLHVYELAD
jgi:hypothetical protein